MATRIDSSITYSTYYIYYTTASYRQLFGQLKWPLPRETSSLTIQQICYRLPVLSTTCTRIENVKHKSRLCGLWARDIAESLVLRRVLEVLGLSRQSDRATKGLQTNRSRLWFRKV